MVIALARTFLSTFSPYHCSRHRFWRRRTLLRKRMILSMFPHRHMPRPINADNLQGYVKTRGYSMNTVSVARICALMCFSSLTACAASSGIFQTQSNVYQITTTAPTILGGIAAARRSGVETATAYCAQRGQNVLVVQVLAPPPLTKGSSDFTFRCVQNSTPNVRPAPPPPN